jgi:hypothetical protein
MRLSMNREMTGEIALPLVSRRVRSQLPALAASWLIGVPFAALCMTVALGLGVEPLDPAGTRLMVLMAAGLIAPAIVVTWRTVRLRRPARLRVRPDELAIEYPELLRAPLIVPRDAVRVAAVDGEGWLRFRVHASSGPYFGGDDDVFLAFRRGSPLPILPPDRGRPNVALLFSRPVPSPPLRRQTGGGLLRGERMAGLLLAVRDPAAAERALDSCSLLRPLTMPDLFAVEELLGDPSDDPASGARRALQHRGLVRWGWGLVVVGLVAPVFAICALLPAVVLWFRGERRRPALMAASGLSVFAARLAIYVG